jgi:ferredoxin, 2Fe-2S
MPATPPIALTLIAADGHRHGLQVPPRGSLMKAAVDAGIDAIAADCGGSLSCATCHVVVDAAWRDRVAALAPVSRDEAAMLEMTAVPAGEGSRLSCQIPLVAALDGLVVHLPERQY